MLDPVVLETSVAVNSPASNNSNIYVVVSHAVVAVLTGISTFALGLYRAQSGREKSRSEQETEYRHHLMQHYDGLIESIKLTNNELREEVSRMWAKHNEMRTQFVNEIDQLRQENAQWRKENLELRGRIDGLNCNMRALEQSVAASKSS